MLANTLENLYSLSELAQLLSMSEEDILKVAKENKFDYQDIDGSLYLKKDEQENLIELLLPILGVSHQYYEIPDSLKNCNTPWAATLVKMYQQKFSCPASLSPAQGDFLRTLVSNIAPKTVVEIGCFTGISTVWMAAGLEQTKQPGTIHSIDLFIDIVPRLPYHCGYLPNPLEYAQKSVEAAQLSHRVKFYQGNSVAIGEKIDQIVDEPIDFLYIDGDHTKEGCYKDFILYYPHVAVGGYIILHDIYPEHCNWDGPRYVIDKYIKNSPHFELLEVKTHPVNYGIAVIRKLSSNTNLDMLSKLRKTEIWQRIKGTPLANLIKNTLPFK